MLTHDVPRFGRTPAVARRREGGEGDGGPFPVVQANEDVERLYAELASGVPALIAAQDDRPVSIITKADLLEFVAHQRKRR